MSADGRSSRISRPIVAFPATTAGSLTGWMKRPWTSGCPCSSSTRHQRSKGSRTIRPPSASIAAIFTAGAESGTITVQETPSRRAFQATPCAMLPALAVTTPRASSSGLARAIALPEPRILNDPIGCRFSSFSQSVAPSTSSGSSGVRRAIPSRRRAASRISESGGASIGVVASAPEIQEAPRAARLRLPVDVSRRCDVFDRETERLEERDFPGQRRPGTDPISTSPSSPTMWPSSIAPSAFARRKSPDSWRSDSRRSAYRRARATAAVSSSRAEAMLAPTALTCAPSAIQPPARTGHAGRRRRADEVRARDRLARPSQRLRRRRPWRGRRARRELPRGVDAPARRRGPRGSVYRADVGLEVGAGLDAGIPGWARDPRRRAGRGSRVASPLTAAVRMAGDGSGVDHRQEAPVLSFEEEHGALIGALDFGAARSPGKTVMAFRQSTPSRDQQLLRHEAEGADAVSGAHRIGISKAGHRLVRARAPAGPISHHVDAFSPSAGARPPRPAQTMRRVFTDRRPIGLRKILERDAEAHEAPGGEHEPVAPRSPTDPCLRSSRRAQRRSTPSAAAPG